MEDREDIPLKEERELDFNDVLILPQPSSLSSRSNVNLERTIKFVNENGPSSPTQISKKLQTNLTLFARALQLNCRENSLNNSIFRLF